MSSAPPPRPPARGPRLTIGRIMIGIALLAVSLEGLLELTGSSIGAFAGLALFAACIGLYTRTGPVLPTRTQETDRHKPDITEDEAPAETRPPDAAKGEQPEVTDPS